LKVRLFNTCRGLKNFWTFQQFCRQFWIASQEFYQKLLAKLRPRSKKKEIKLKRPATKKLSSISGFGKALYRRTNSSAPVGENCLLRGFDKYFSSHFSVILYVCVFSCVEYILRRKVVAQVQFYFFSISKFFDVDKLKNDNLIIIYDTMHACMYFSININAFTI